MTITEFHKKIANIIRLVEAGDCTAQGGMDKIKELQDIMAKEGPLAGVPLVAVTLQDLQNLEVEASESESEEDSEY